MSKKCPRNSESLAARVRYGKTDLRYWHRAVFHPTYTLDGVAHQSSEWAVKIQHLRRRETFPLGTANRAAAAAKAKKIYLTPASNGWDTALTKFKQKSEMRSEIATTVGSFSNSSFRQDAALAILTYKWGRPVERQISAHADATDFPELLRRLKASPAAKAIEDSDQKTVEGKEITPALPERPCASANQSDVV